MLRRLIARRCIYGVDINPLSVQLARLAVWIHTFVPGLPLSFLDHNLTHGNSLIGVGDIEEIKIKFQEGEGTLFAVDAKSLLGAAAEPLRRLADVNDATLEDIDAARTAVQESRAAISETKSLCDLIVAQSISSDRRIVDFMFEDWLSSKDEQETQQIILSAEKEINKLQVLHFPITFPEVFLRESGGFDVLIGNPPWQEAMVDEHGFWARYFPGLRGKSQSEQETEKSRLRKERPDLVAVYEAEKLEMEILRRALVTEAYPGMGTGDPDLYKAFCWRFWNLIMKQNGHIGVVLPRSALSAKGSTEFRKTVFSNSTKINLTFLINNRRWVFEDVHPQYSFVLVSLMRGKTTDQSIQLHGPFDSDVSFRNGIDQAPVSLTYDEILSWSDTSSIPLFPTPESVNLFRQIRTSPRLDLNMGGGLASSPRPRNGRYNAEESHGLRKSYRNWRARPDAELHATSQKGLMILGNQDQMQELWPVYKGSSFEIWNPDTGIYYAWADPKPVTEWLNKKRQRAGSSQIDSPHGEFTEKHLNDLDTLPCFKPRIAFRNSTNRTNSRTVIACLLPPNIFIANQAPYFLWPRGNEKDQAFLLGVLCSIPLDWYARRVAESNLNFHVINPFPIPRPNCDDPLWQRAVEISGRLASPDERFAEWAKRCGVSWGELEVREKENLVFELDAVIAHLYGLTEAQLVHIFETFHREPLDQLRVDSARHFYVEWQSLKNE